MTKCWFCGDDGIKYGDHVEILKGFHKGKQGKVIDEGRTCGTYRIKFANGEEAYDILGSNTKKI